MYIKKNLRPTFLGVKIRTLTSVVTECTVKWSQNTRYPHWSGKHWGRFHPLVFDSDWFPGCLSPLFWQQRDALIGQVACSECRRHLLRHLQWWWAVSIHNSKFLGNRGKRKIRYIYFMYILISYYRVIWLIRWSLKIKSWRYKRNAYNTQLTNALKFK